MSWTVDDLLASLPEPEAYAIADGATLRASWAGSCERVISYRVQGVQPSDVLPLEIRFAFAVGHALQTNRGTEPVRTIKVTLDELATLQGFPAGWPFQGTKTSVAQQVGNAVPPRLAEVCVRAVTGEAARCA